MRRLAAGVLWTLLLLAVVAGAGLGWGWHVFHSPGPSAQDTRIVLPRGVGLWDIAERLAAAGVVRDAWLFAVASRLSGAARQLKAGEYSIPAGASPDAVLALLKEGRTVIRRLTIPEGLSSAEVIALVTGAEGLSGPPPPVPPEGTLLPETYHYQWGDGMAVMVGRMRQAMEVALDQAWAARQPGLPFDSPTEALVLASIVEKETAIPAERPRIAAVFINRLRRGMRLQSDPTVAYGLTGGDGPLGRDLTRADLAQPTPFNTYQISGLPPQPIANPGRAAIAAVLQPLATDELYFVADGSGGHAFAATLDEHNRNVRRWRRLQRRSSP